LLSDGFNNSFGWNIQADPPDTSRIPVADAVGVTVVLLTCSYRGKEFVRVGYYVNNEYSDPELREVPPTTPQYDKVSLEEACLSKFMKGDLRKMEK
jgi:hypothetical protein